MYQLQLFERWRYNLRPRATSSLVRRASGILSSKPQRRKPSLLRPKTVPSVKEMSSSERLWSNCSSHPLRGKIFWRQSTIPKFICYEHMRRASKAHYWCELQLKIDKSKTIYAKYTYTVGRAVTVPLRRTHILARTWPLHSCITESTVLCSLCAQPLHLQSNGGVP